MPKKLESGKGLLLSRGRGVGHCFNFVIFSSSKVKTKMQIWRERGRKTGQEKLLAEASAQDIIIIANKVYITFQGRMEDVGFSPNGCRLFVVTAHPVCSCRHSKYMLSQITEVGVCGGGGGACLAEASGYIRNNKVYTKCWGRVETIGSIQMIQSFNVNNIACACLQLQMKQFRTIMRPMSLKKGMKKLQQKVDTQEKS